MKSWFRNLGPGVLVSAAFIGPGTVTVCTLAGVEFGFSLLWALLLSIMACLVLQEMAARLGLVTQSGLSATLKREIQNPVIKFASLVLIFAAIVLGNAAYEAGNITGAALGLSAILPSYSIHFGAASIDIWSLLIGGIALLLLALGNYRLLERVFIALVLIMSLSFLVTAVLTRPDPVALLEGLFIPTPGQAGLLTVMALIGTTVVPYNVFLHASLVGEKWSSKDQLPLARRELFLAITIGGLVSMAIVITAAGSGVQAVEDVPDLARGLEPLYGRWATGFIAVGLFAAGITSSITAPLAAAYVVSGCLGWQKGLTSKRFKIVWASILLLGIIFSSLGIKPVDLIKFAQVANGILLPVIALFLFWMVNKTSVMGENRNSRWQNAAGIFIIAISLFLGAKSILIVLQEF